MSKSQWALVFATLFLLAVLLYGFVGGGPSLDSDGDEAVVDWNGSIWSDEGADEPVVGLKGAAKNEASVGIDLPAPANLRKVDRERDLHGIVVREDGTPVPGARVLAIHYPWRYARLLTDGAHDEQVTAAETSSALDGTFSMRLRPGDHVHLRVFGRALAPVELSMLQAGEFVRVVLRPPVRLIVQARAPGGSPAVGLAVRVMPRGRRGGLWYDETATTGEDGTCAFELPPGGSVFLDPEPEEEGWGQPGWITVQLPQTGEVIHELELAEGRTLRGTVTDEKTGQPIRGARVGMNWNLRPEVETDENGRYELHGWTGEGVRDIHVLAEGYGRAQVDVGAKEVIDFRLVRGLVVKGRVVDEAGEPLMEAQVLAIASQLDSGQQEISMDSADTKRDGTFVLKGLRPDMAHPLTVIKRGYAQHMGSVSTQPAGGVLDLGDIIMRPACVVMGEVSSADGKPLPRVPVALRVEETSERYGRSWERMTDDLGRFRFEDLPTARYRIASRPEGSSGTQQTVIVTTHEKPYVVRLRQEAARAVRVLVTDEDANPLHGMYVQASGQRKNVRSQTDENGVAMLQLPPIPMQIRLFLGPDGGWLPPQSIKLSADAMECTFVLEKAVLTSGTLLDPAGKPLPWATMDVEEKGKRIEWARTNAEGKFYVRTRRDLTFSIVFYGKVAPDKSRRYRPDTAPMKGRTDAVRAGTKDVVIRATALDASGSLRVRVLDPEGNPLQGILLSLNPSPVKSQFPQTDADGWARLEGLQRRLTRVEAMFTSSLERPWLRPRVEHAMPDGQELVLQMRRGARIEGTLLKSDESPASGGTVTVWIDKRPAFQAQANEQGRFVVVVDPDEKRSILLQSQQRLPNGTFLMARQDSVRPGDTGIVLRLRRGP